MSTFLNFFPREKYIRKLVEALITQDDYSEYDENDGDDGDDSGGVGDDDDYQGKLIEAGYAEKPGWRVKSIATSEEQNVIVCILYYGQPHLRNRILQRQIRECKAKYLSRHMKSLSISEWQNSFPDNNKNSFGNLRGRKFVKGNVIS